jgi:hypothetical protein
MAVSAAVAIAAPAQASACPGSPALCYRYVDRSQGSLNSSTTGASASFTVESPTLDTPDYHTLAQFAAYMGPDIIEAGWIVDRSGLNGADFTNPHLFISWWKNGVFQCYNFGCSGMVDYAPNTQNAGDSLVADVHTTKTLGLIHSGGAWWIQYGSNYVASINDSFMSAPAATSLTQISYFGEIAESRMGSLQECTDMGNGLNPNGTAGGVSYAQFTNYQLYGTGHSTASFNSGAITNATKWGMNTTGGVSTSFSYGGTGDPHCTTPKVHPTAPLLTPAQTKRNLYLVR